MVRIREGPIDWGWGIVVSVMRKTVAVNAAANAEDIGPASAYILDLLLSCDAGSIKGMILANATTLHPCLIYVLAYCQPERFDSCELKWMIDARLAFCAMVFPLPQKTASKHAINTPMHGKAVTPKW